MRITVMLNGGKRQVPHMDAVLSIAARSRYEGRICANHPVHGRLNHEDIIASLEHWQQTGEVKVIKS